MNLIKVFRNPKLALILGVFFMFISCNQDEIITNDSLEFETKSLKSKVKEDNDFSLLISKNIAFSKAFMKKLHDKALLNKKNFLFKNLNEKQILKELGMDKMFENHLNEINQFILAIKNRHPNINILKADDLSPIYEEIKKGLNTTNNIKLLSRVDECDDQFESDFHTIHANYDKAITWCTVLSLLTLGVGSPCYYYAVGSAITDMVVAIENHATCKANL